MWSIYAVGTPIISCFIKIQIGLTFLVPAYQVVSEKRLAWLGVGVRIVQVDRHSFSPLIHPLVQPLCISASGPIFQSGSRRSLGRSLTPQGRTKLTD